MNCKSIKKDKSMIKTSILHFLYVEPLSVELNFLKKHLASIEFKQIISSFEKNYNEKEIIAISLNNLRLIFLINILLKHEKKKSIFFTKRKIFNF